MPRRSRLKKRVFVLVNGYSPYFTPHLMDFLVQEIDAGEEYLAFVTFIEMLEERYLLPHSSDIALVCDLAKHFHLDHIFWNYCNYKANQQLFPCDHISPQNIQKPRYRKNKADSSANTTLYISTPKQIHPFVHLESNYRSYHTREYARIIQKARGTDA